MFKLAITSRDSGMQHEMTFREDGYPLACQCPSRKNPCKHLVWARSWHTMIITHTTQDTADDRAEPLLLRRDTGPRLLR